MLLNKHTWVKVGVLDPCDESDIDKARAVFVLLSTNMAHRRRLVKRAVDIRFVGLTYARCYRGAVSSSKEMLLYVMRDEAQVQGKVFDHRTEPQRKASLDRIKKHTVREFTTMEEVARHVYENVGKL